MRTLEYIGTRFLRFSRGVNVRGKGGIVVVLPILVIAFVIKSHGFEDKSDIIRQALRQEEIIGIIQKKLGSKYEVIFPSIRLDNVYDSICSSINEWEKKNPDKTVVFIACIGPTAFRQKPLFFGDGSFAPTGIAVFYTTRSQK